MGEHRAEASKIGGEKVGPLGIVQIGKSQAESSRGDTVRGTTLHVVHPSQAGLQRKVEGGEISERTAWL